MTYFFRLLPGTLRVLALVGAPGLVAACAWTPVGPPSPDAAPREPVGRQELPPLVVPPPSLSAPVSAPAPAPVSDPAAAPDTAPATFTATATASVGVGTSAPEPGAQDNTAPCSMDAVYRVTFDATWSAETHPTDFPGAAHFSSPVIVAHAEAGGFWSYGELASPGMEQMAETGATRLLSDEIATLTEAGLAGEIVLGSNFSTPGEAVLEVAVDDDHPYLSFVSMVAPSPDWFVGIEGVGLCGHRGWMEEVGASLFPLDAGTDDGTSFPADNAASEPRVAIARLSNDAASRRYGRLAYGTLKITRIVPPIQGTAGPGAPGAPVVVPVE